MQSLSTAHRKLLDDTVERLGTLGESLVAVVLYGSAARGDYHPETSDLNLLVVLRDLELATLRPLRGALEKWRAKGQPMPRLLSPALIADASDVFPIEFLDVSTHHEVLRGADPFVGLEVDVTNLRVHCERELREKMMRLAEGFLETGDRDKELRRLMVASYPSFVALFRGCLHLLQQAVPAANVEVSSAFCRVAGVDPAPFLEVEKLARGETVGDAMALFQRYHASLAAAADLVDRFVPGEKGIQR